MAVMRKEQKEKSRNVLLRASIPAPLMAEIKKTKKLCKDNGFFFDINHQKISATCQVTPSAAGHRPPWEQGGGGIESGHPWPLKYSFEWAAWLKALDISRRSM